MEKSHPTLLYTDNGYGCEDVTGMGFVGLMDLYENNFIRFRKLVNRLGDGDKGASFPGEVGDSAVSVVPGYQDLHLEILEQGRFTSTVCLTYRFIEDNRLHTEPNLICRVYHDARMVEVMSGNLHHGREQHDRLPRESAMMKWKLNRFLFKWLGFCLHAGHAFVTFQRS